MLKRQKTLLALLEHFGGELNNTDMQKYLFLLCQEEKKTSYHFIPYKYGCFSFQAYHDKRKMTEKGQLCDSENWKLSRKGFYDNLPYDQRELIWSVKEKYGKLKGNDLIKYIYQNYPYYAIHSNIAARIMTNDEMRKIKKCQPLQKENCLSTIGYEGYDLEQFLNILVQNNIRLLCDVRKNPLSRKYGFSKKSISNACQTINIQYVHMPQFGIPTTLRKDLTTLQDYQKLFDLYEREILSHLDADLHEMKKVLNHHKRISLFCYEKDPHYCHRTRVARKLLSMIDNITFEEF